MVWIGAKVNTTRKRVNHMIPHRGAGAAPQNAGPMLTFITTNIWQLDYPRIVPIEG